MICLYDILMRVAWQVTGQSNGGENRPQSRADGTVEGVPVPPRQPTRPSGAGAHRVGALAAGRSVGRAIADVGECLGNSGGGPACLGQRLDRASRSAHRYSARSACFGSPESRPALDTFIRVKVAPPS